MEDMSSSAYYHHHQSHPPPPGSHYPPSYYPPPPIPGAPFPPPPPHHHHHPHHNHQYPPPPPLDPYHHQHHYEYPPPQPMPAPQHYPYPSAYALPPPPQFVAPAAADPAASDGEVKTLFVAGLPDDVKVREIYNLFREFPGYQSSQLRSQFIRPYAFAVFADQQSAVSAKNALHGMAFDLEKESTLYVEFAKSNSRVKRARADDGGLYSPDKKMRGPNSRGFLDSGVGSNNHMPGMGNSAYSMNVYPSAQSHAIYDYGAGDSGEPDKLSNSTPCPTLFVANLGATCSQQELSDVFSRCPGFLKLKIQTKNGLPAAFVDFKDVACSAEAKRHLQGTFLHSSPGKPMRLEYAKSRMGLKGRERKT
ncbi:putative U2 small nuclear ribonucleoprotein B'' [Iris pallida]|uniref:U2 small nuclear ribonucleoprotein B n=1 Tax=Iris pallida TaxID=29817 RepID=A0AAX6DWZ6_IRIPA|nr:putative U2 small nuclear ribonucleoprotein B'' [Iris pallida]